MRWFLDTEFNDNGRTIDLISIALAAEDGRNYYAVSSEFDPKTCNDWVKANVLPKLPPRETWKSRAAIASHLLDALRSSKNPQIWAYFASYDWVAFCQLFGPMINLPDGLPMYCMDLKQLMVTKGIHRSDLPEQPPGSAHDALADAIWTRDAYLSITSRTR